MQVENIQSMVTEADVPGMYKMSTAALFHFLHFFPSIMLNYEHCLYFYFKIFKEKMEYNHISTKKIIYLV